MKRLPSLTGALMNADDYAEGQLISAFQAHGTRPTALIGSRSNLQHCRRLLTFASPVWHHCCIHRKKDQARRDSGIPFNLHKNFISFA
jgi:hypothetical protein